MSRKLFIYNDLEFREELPFFGQLRGLLKEDLRPAAPAPPAAIPEMKTAPAPGHLGFRIAHIGGKFGLNSATINGEGVEDLDIDEQGAKSGFCLGGFITIKISKYLGFQPEILISSKGTIDTLDYET